MPYLLIIVNIHVAVNNIKPSSVVMEAQEWVQMHSCPSYRIFPTAVCNINVIRASLISTQ